MARSFVGAATGSSLTANAGPTITIPFPSGTAAGDQVWVGAGWNGSGTVTTPPAGWTAIESSPSIGAAVSTAIYKKVVDAGDVATGSAQIVISAATRGAWGSMAYRGSDYSQNAVLGQTTANAANQSIPASATADANSMVGAMMFTNSASDPAALSAPSGWTKQSESITTNGSGNKASFAVFTKNVDVNSGSATSAAVPAATSSRSNAWTILAKDAVTGAVIGWVSGAISMGK